MKDFFSRQSWIVAGLALFVMASCDRSALPTEPPADVGGGVTLPSEQTVWLAAVSCSASVAAGRVECSPLSGASLASLRLAREGGALPAPEPLEVILGGQGNYVRLASDNVAYDGTEFFTFDVTVQNLILQSLGTTDGTTLDPAGVRVFFHEGPVVTGGTGTIVVNGDGVGTFTASNQPFYQYDQVLAPNETSAARGWSLTMPPTVDTFGFLLYVSAAVQHPDGWIEFPDAGPARLLAGSGDSIAAVVRTVVGRVDTAAVVSWSSSNTTVATVDGTGNVAALTPGFSTITATSGARSGSLELGVCPNLPVGGVYTAAMPLASRLCFGGAGETMEFTYMPVNLSSASALSLTVTATGIMGVTGPPTPDLRPESGVALRSLSDLGAGAALTPAASLVERESLMGREKISPRTAVAALSPGTAGIHANIVPGVPSLGDLWSLNVAQGCGGTRDDRVGQVRSIGNHVIIVADTANPAGGFTTAQYDSIRMEFDSIAFPVVSGNFGAPTDLDSNSRIVLFYTRAVNELSPPASSVVFFAEFRSRDLFSSAPESCPRSNEGEIIYMLVPDPTGTVNSNVRTVSQVRGATVGEAGAQLASLVNASRRIYVTGASSFEEPWLDAGLRRIALELMFYRTSFGLAPGGNIQLSSLTSGPFASRRVAAFNIYANATFANLRSWLQRPDTSGAFKTNVTLAQQGATWGFLRYAADRRVPSSDQTAFWSSLVDSGLSGVENLTNAIGADANEWLRDFVAAMYADDVVAGIAPQYIQPSWHFRSVYGGLGGFPLGTRPLSNDTPLTLSYSRSGGAAYARFGVAASGFADLTALSGGVAPTSPYSLIVVRTK